MTETAPYQPHSDTSKAAATTILPKVGTARRKVYDEFVKRKGLGATDNELALQLGMNPSTVRPRRIELIEQGFIGDSGQTRATTSNRQAVVWRLTEYGVLPNEKKPTAKEPEPEVVLKMSKDVAMSLHAVTRQIGGCPKKSRRRHIDAIRQVLEAKGAACPPQYGDDQWIVGNQFRDGV